MLVLIEPLRLLWHVVPCIFFVNCKVCQNQWFMMFKHEEILLSVLLVCVYQFHEKVKKLMLLVKRCKMHYFNLGYNVILDSRFTFCCFM
jgi:hypothetical protein